MLIKHVVYQDFLLEHRNRNVPFVYRITVLKINYLLLHFSFQYLFLSNSVVKTLPVLLESHFQSDAKPYNYCSLLQCKSCIAVTVTVQMFFI